VITILKMEKGKRGQGSSGEKWVIAVHELCMLMPKGLFQWKRISCEQSVRWQHLSQLKARVFLSLQKKYLVVKKCNNLYL
jgi:hypothetical protein